MRTTIELSDATYRALRAEALDRGARGFSPIVEEALVAYLTAAPERRRLLDAIAHADGAWDEDDVREFEASRREAWATWSTDRFSTPTS